MVSSTPLAPSVAQSLDPNLSETDWYAIKVIQECKQEASDARASRIAKNRRNRDVYLSRQDWSGKKAGQSQQFLPKVPVSVEQMASFIKRGLTMFGNWFSVDLAPDMQQMMSESDCVNILNAFLENLWSTNNRDLSFSTIASDAVKVGLLESLMIFKVHGSMKMCRRYKVNKTVTLQGNQAAYGEPEMQMEEYPEWRLRIDLIRPEDYYVDPTGRGLYEIHRVERDLHEIVALVDEGIYDRRAVNELIDVDFGRPLDEERTDKDRAQDEAINPAMRKRVLLDEFWGTMLDTDGTILHRNVVATVANEKYLIRKPEANPFWHQKSPFVVTPIIRVPFSEWHKALYDDASELNLAINEMFNLMLDGGMASVWGIKQVKIGQLEDPSQVAEGIPQGSTLAVKDTMAPGDKVVEVVAQGQVPQDALAIFQFLNNEFAGAALTNELKMGNLPTKQVRSTEVVEASQSQAVTLDGMIGDMEVNGFDEILNRAWSVILQNADDIPSDVLVNLSNKQTAVAIMDASPQERFATFQGLMKFKARGLSQTMSRAREFQKLMAMLQTVAQSPLLMQAFMKEYSTPRVLQQIMKTLNINSTALEKTAEEKQQDAIEAARTERMSQIMNGGGDQAPNGGASTPPGGEPGMPSEINQLGKPATGMTPNA
jgi:hypothetical protein